jgi:hypothetical protein
MTRGGILRTRIIHPSGSQSPDDETLVAWIATAIPGFRSEINDRHLMIKARADRGHGAISTPAFRLIVRDWLISADCCENVALRNKRLRAGRGPTCRGQSCANRTRIN